LTLSLVTIFATVGRPSRAQDLESLKGTWNIDAMEWGGKSLPKELIKGYKFNIGCVTLTRAKK
jgi:hypothetical protein